MIKVKVPLEIPCGGYSFKIRLTHDLVRDTGKRGQITWHKELVEIDDNMPADITDATFRHEISHLADKVFLGESMAESQIGGMSEGLFQMTKAMGIKLDWSDIKK